MLREAFGGSYKALFWVSLAASFIGLILELSIRLPKRDFVPEKKVLSLDRFFLLDGWREAIGIACFAFSYGILSTYVAIYGKEELGITGGTGLFFGLCAIGLILSRLTGARYLRDGKVSRNASMGMCVSLVGYFLFAAIHNPIGYYGAGLIVGLGNGHMYPAFQTMFINLAPNSQRGTANSTLLTSWDIGLGIGVLLGGSLAEFFGYHTAFWMAWMVHLAGVALFFACTRRHFVRHRLR
jgi:predicted MFS family arabinose efflux permease